MGIHSIQNELAASKAFEDAVELFDTPEGRMLGWGSSAPSDGDTGYAPGGLFINTGGGAGAQLLVNENTKASASWAGVEAIGASGAAAARSIALATGETVKYGTTKLTTVFTSGLTALGNMDTLPDSHDPAAQVRFGDGTTDADVVMFVGSTSEYAIFDVGASRFGLYGVPLYSAGSGVDGITFAGTYTGNVIDFSSATIDPTGSNGPCFIRAGTYASPIDYGAENDQSGMIRLYSTCSGNGTSYDRGLFVCTRTTGAKGAFPVAGLAEANNTGTGPAKLQAAQFIAHLGADGSASKLATLGGDATAGMYGAWLKIAAGGTCEAQSGSRCAPCWIDNQMSGSVNGEEYGIFASTGASRPDAFIGFNTTSSGYTQLFNFDATFDSGAGTCVTTDAVPGGNQDARIKVYYNGTQYYIPLYR